MRLTSILLIFSGILLVAGCSMQPAGNNNKAGTLGTLNDIIANIPEYTVDMPKSLQVKAPEQRRPASRAEGDIKVYNGDNLESLKAQGWYDLQIYTGNTNLNAALDILKKYAEQNVIISGVPFELGVWDYEGLAYNMGKNLDCGKAVVYQNEHSIEILWHFTLVIEADGTANEYPCYYHFSLINNGDDDYKIEVVSENKWLSFTDNPFMLYMSYGTNMNPIIVSSQPIDESTDNLMMLKCYNNTDGSLCYMNRLIFSFGEYHYIGWGNDSNGGLMTKYVYENSTSMRVEYYDGNGDLLCNTDYDDEVDSWRFETSYGTKINIYDYHPQSTPEVIYIKDGYSAKEILLSFDKVTFISIPVEGNAFYDYVWKQGAEWTTGDAGYSFEASEKINDIGFVSEYRIGYVAPEQEEVFGTQFYTNYEYPLKRLLPLTEKYDNYQLVELEGETRVTSWTDEDGEEQTLSFTDYSYFLDYNNNLLLDETGDIFLNNIDMKKVYLVDYVNDWKSTQIKAPFVYSSGTLPSYFNFTEQESVDKIKAQLISLFNNDFQNLSIDDYTHRLQKISTNPLFDNLK